MKNRSPKRLTRNARVEIRFLEALQQRLPHHLRILEGLLEANNQHGRFKEGLSIAQHVVAMIPGHADAWYNLASSYALNDHPTEAIAALARAIQMGYDDYRWILADQELISLRNDPRFKRLLNQLRQVEAPR